MNLITLSPAQGVLLVILGLMGGVAGESVFAGWAIEVTSDLLTLNRGFAISPLAVVVIVLRIPTWAGNNLREPAFIRGAINTVLLLM